MRFNAAVLIISIVLVSLLVPMVFGGCSQTTTTATVTTTVTAPAPNQAAGTAQTQAPSSGQSVTWVFNWGAAPDRTAEGAAWAPGNRFEQLLLKNSGGRFKLTIREAMVPKGTEFDLLATNKAQISDTGLTDVAGTYPVFDYAALPFRFNNLYELEAAQNDPQMRDIFDKVSRSGGNTYLSAIPSGVMAFVWAKKPVLAVNDFKGLKVRVRGAIAVEALTQLGASPVLSPLLMEEWMQDY
jgi:TRAP-type C4-dicarboxylate transport system substrate-binding protein